jgi:ADP-ribose pyrophosphatase YjhB (NUDIX family)
MNFCSKCGNDVEQIIPEGDTRLRWVCPNCNTIHYENPRVIAGTLPIWEDKVLLCKRAIEPRRGYWTLPAGFLENGETVEAGATRETTEEANAELNNLALYTLFSLPHISQVYMFFKADLANLNFYSGSESLDVALFSESEVPWDELAFPVVNKTLAHYFSDRQNDIFPTHYENILFRDRLKR